MSKISIHAEIYVNSMQIVCNASNIPNESYRNLFALINSGISYVAILRLSWSSVYESWIPISV